MLLPLVIAPIAVGGFVDTYYAYNLNEPADRASFASGTGTSAKRANEFGLNLAAIDLSAAPEPVGFRLILSYGDGASVVHAAEPSAFQFVQQASVIWQVTPGLQLEAGIYPSHIGFEVLPSKDNWTYTRSWMGEFSPYYQTGVKVSYAFTDQLLGQLHVLNGWQNIAETNDGKAIGTQLAWNSDVWSVAFNTFAESSRLFGDVVLVARPTQSLQLALAIDAGQQDDAVWGAAGLSVRNAFTDEVAVAARFELFDDPDAGITGAGQRLWEGTLALEVRPADGLVIKLEGRYDQSDADVFSGGEPGELVDQQALVVLGAVVSL